MMPVSEMSEEIYKDYCVQKIKNFKDEEMPKGSFVEKMHKKVKKHQAPPKMPDFRKEDKEMLATEAMKDREGEWMNHTNVDSQFLVDPSKDGFLYFMMQRSKEWEKDEAWAKVSTIEKVMVKDEETEILDKMGKMMTNPKVLLMIGMIIMLGKIWLPKMLLEAIKDVVEMMLKIMGIGLTAKIAMKLEKISKMAKILLEEISVMKEKMLVMQIMMSKIEMSLVVKGGNINRLIKMAADKISQLEYIYMDDNARPDDYGRKITNYLA